MSLTSCSIFRDVPTYGYVVYSLVLRVYIKASLTPSPMLSSSLAHFNYTFLLQNKYNLPTLQQS